MTPLYIADYIDKFIKDTNEAVAVIQSQLLLLPEDSSKHCLWLYTHLKQQHGFFKEKLQNIINEMERNAGTTI